MKKKIFSVLALGLIFGSYTAPFTNLGAVEADTQAQTVKEACVYTNGDPLEFSYYDNITLTSDVDCQGNTIVASHSMYGNLEGNTFDGQGHTISNATIVNGTGSYTAAGIFNGIDSTATVKNVTLDNIVVNGDSNSASAGALAGMNDGTIENVTVKNSQVTGSTNIGGAVGYNKGTMTNVVVEDSSVKSTGGEGTATGGVLGRNEGTADIVATDLGVQGIRNLGGAVGSNDGGTVEASVTDSVVRTTVDSTTTTEHDMDAAIGRDIGGAVGSNNGGTVHDSTAIGGSVTGSKTIGGLVGWNGGEITDSRTSTITVTGNNSVGGIAGKTDEKAGVDDIIDNTLSNATVVAHDSYAGGIVGLTASKSIVQHAWYDGDSVTAAASAGGVIGTNASGAKYENINNMSGKAAVDAQDDRLEGCLIGYNTDTDGPINGDGTNCISDTVAPTLTANSEATVEAGEENIDYITLFNAIATDDTDTAIQDKITVDSSSVDVNTLGDYPVVFSVSDAAGNSAPDVTSTLHVVDTTAPVINADADAYVNVGTASVDYINTFNVEAIDNLDGDITESVVVDDSLVDLNTIGTYEVTFNVTDSSGIAATPVTSTLHVKDATAPVMTTDAEATVEAGTESVDYIDLFNVSSIDNLDGDVTTTVTVDDSAVDLGTVGDYEVIFTSTDSDMNTTTVNAVLHVVDTTAPVITLTDSEYDAYIGETLDYKSFVESITDNADHTLTADDVIIDARAVDMTTAGDYEVTFTVTDASGNESDEVILTIHVMEDTEAPVITLTDSETTIEVGTKINKEFFASYIDEVTDNATTDMTITVNHNINSNVVGDYEAIYTAKDLAGNVSDEATLLVHVVDDSTTDGNNGSSTTDSNDSSDEELTNTGSTVGITLLATTVLVGMIIIVPFKRG